MSAIAFLGTPESAVPVLRALEAAAGVELVITRPDRAKGRSRVPQPPPVKEAAVELGLEVAQPATKGELDEVLAGRPLDLGVVAAFGMIIPARTLARPVLGMVNIHFSVLPRWRGAAPVERAILAGDRTTGVTLMQMDAGLDTGPVLATWETSIGEDEAGGELTTRLAAAGAELLTIHLEALLAGRLAAGPQPEEGATYAPMLDTDETWLDVERDAASLAKAVRAFDPRPGARFSLDGEPFKVFRPSVVEPAVLPPGALHATADGLLIGTGEGALLIAEVQPAGRRRMPAVDWLRGVHGELGRLT